MFPDQPANQRHWWLLKEPGSDSLDLCLHHPGYDVDLEVRANLETLTRLWMGDLNSADALRSGALTLEGSARLKLSIHDWISLSVFAGVEPFRSTSPS